MISERYLMHYIENNPQEIKSLFSCFFRHLSKAEKQEFIRDLLGEESFETLQWCAECRRAWMDLAKITEDNKI